LPRFLSAREAGETGFEPQGLDGRWIVCPAEEGKQLADGAGEIHRRTLLGNIEASASPLGPHGFDQVKLGLPVARGIHEKFIADAFRIIARHRGNAPAVRLGENRDVAGVANDVH
jgi:hypothetical protein